MAEAARDDVARTRTMERDEAPASRHLREVARDTQASGETPPATGTAPPKRAKRRVRGLLFAALPVALVAGGYAYVTGGQAMSTDNAYVRADMVGVSTDVSGIVKTVEVHDNQDVATGQVLFRLDDEPFRLALDRADAELGSVRDDTAALKASYHDMDSQMREQQVAIDYDQREFERQQSLVTRGAATQATFDQSQRNLLGAREKLASLRHQQDRIAASLGGNPDARIEDLPKYKEALARRDEAARQLAHTTVVAPMPGIVTNVPSLQPGQYLTASTAAFSVVSRTHVWIEANPKETELTWVRPGQEATVTVDTYPDQAWQGTVESIAPASGASFSLLPAQNTSGNWVKVVQRIALRVRIETPDDKPPLRAGMSVEVDVNTGHARGLPTFVARLLDHWAPGASAALARPNAG